MSWYVVLHSVAAPGKYSTCVIIMISVPPPPALLVFVPRLRICTSVIINSARERKDVLQRGTHRVGEEVLWGQEIR